MSEQPQHQSNLYGVKRGEIEMAENILPKLNKPLPNDEGAEHSLLCYAMQTPGWFTENFTTIHPAMFYKPANRLLWESAVDFFIGGGMLDPSLLTYRLRGEGTLEAVGGPARVVEVFTDMQVPGVAVHHVRLLRDMMIARQNIHAHARAMQSLLETPMDNEGTLATILDMSKGIMEEALTVPGKRLKRMTMEQAVGMVIDEIDERVKNPDKLPGWPTGFATLDKHMRCLQKGRVTVFAGMPSDGKSAIMQNCAMGALRAGAKVGWYSLEMPISEQTLRIIAEECGIPNDSLYDGQMNRGQFDALQSAVRRMKTMGAELIDTDGATAQDLITDIEKGGYDIAVIDYLQLMEDSSSRKSDTRENIISGISRRLKRLAVRTGTHILTASQLNDNGKLRESRAIGQDADAVMIIQKMPANDPRGLPDGQHDEDAEGYDDTRRLLLGEKNRGGKRGFVIPQYFHGATFTFKEIL